MSTQPNLPAVLDAVRILSPLSTSHDHGEGHWRRVATIGLDLARDGGGDPLLIVLFAIFHDSMRFDEYHDPDHGKRGGFLACCLNTELIGLTDTRLDLLYSACATHMDGDVSQDPTIGACWDADRLDLIRFGKEIYPDLMSATQGRLAKAQARARALLDDAPDWATIFFRVDSMVRGVKETDGPAAREHRDAKRDHIWEPAAARKGTPGRQRAPLREPAAPGEPAAPNEPAPARELTPVMGQLVSPEPAEGRRYWTATLVKAAVPSNDENDPA
jgi:uncharacterized protein